MSLSPPSMRRTPAIPPAPFRQPRTGPGRSAATLNARGLHRIGTWGAIAVLAVAVLTASSTGESGPAAWFATAAVASAILAAGHFTRSHLGVAPRALPPGAAMGYLLAYGLWAPQAATLTISLWPAVFAFIGVTLSARVSAWLLPIPAVGIWIAMDLPVAQEISRWLIVMGLVLVVTQLPARLLASLREQQRSLEAEHREVVQAQGRLAVSMERFEQAFDASPVGMSLSDENGRLVEVNRALCELAGRGSEELVGSTARSITHADDRHLIDQPESMVQVPSARPAVTQKRYVRPDGSVRSVEVTVVPVRGPGKHMWTLSHVADVTERRVAEQAEARVQRVSRVLADVTRSVVNRRGEVRDAVVDGAQQLTDASGVALVESADDRTLVVTAATDPRTLGTRISLEQLTMTGTVWSHGEAVDVRDVAAEAAVNPALAEVHAMASGYWQPVLGPSGEVLAVLTASWKVARSATSAEVRGAMEVLAAEAGAALYDDGARRRLEATATLDPLTGLQNRRGWDKTLQQMAGRASATEALTAVAMIDLDRFKHFNDSRGHALGDELLIDFAEVLRQSVRADDLVSRWGGDEFAIAMIVGTADQARTVLDRIVRAVPDGQTCSIGLAMHTGTGEISQTLARADRALYRVKSDGRNGVELAPS